MVRTVALIPVRGGSKSIPGKNIKLLGGVPLLHWTLRAALEAKGIDRVFVSSDSQEILACARLLDDPKLVPLVRPAHLASDTASTESVMLDFAKQHEFDRLVLIQATSPLTRASDLEQALAHMDSVGADSLLTVTHEHRFLWRDQGDGTVVAQNYDPLARPRRQDWSGELVENGAFYVCSRRGLMESGSRLHGRIAYHVMAAQTAVEIDTPDDWSILEALVASRPVPGGGLSDLEHLKLLVTDVDGVLTDSGMYYGSEGELMKKFSTRDGMGLRFWRESGRDVAIVTGENSPAVARRAEKLGITALRLGVADKLPVVMQLAEARGLGLHEVAYIGDDLNDLEALSGVGYSGCPADAHPRVREGARYVCQKPGGAGCVREFVEHMLSRMAK